MQNNKIKIKRPEEIKKMMEGGRKIGSIKAKLMAAIKEGVNAEEINSLAEKFIGKAGGKPSFKMVPGYSWATCINVNDGVVHGIPKKDVVFKKGDIVSVDIGMFYQGFHTDTSFSIGIEPDQKTQRFLSVGRKALENAIGETVAGNRVFDISKAIQSSIEPKGDSVIKALVGHGIGRDLHEGPQVPCFVKGKRDKSPKIPEGAVLAIEVMYAMGGSDLVLSDDGWTISTRDGKISALFEETVAVTVNGPLILTRSRQA
jgi:methionyl aminopeptidase